MITEQTRAEYDAIKDRINFSTLKHMARSPMHYLAAKKGGVSDRDVLVRGRATHMALFEPEKFREECVVFEGKVRRGKEWDSFLERNPDKEHLTVSMHESAVGVAAAVRACEMAQPYLVPGGQYEVSVLWNSAAPPLGGLPGYSFDCKARLDVLQPNAIVDLKSCRDAEQGAFGRQMFDLYAHAQAAWYSDAVAAITGKRLPYVWIASEAAAPYATQVFVADDQVLELGRQAYRGWLDRLNLCTRENRWPAYADNPLPLLIPKWAIPEGEELLEEEAA